MTAESVNSQDECNYVKHLNNYNNSSFLSTIFTQATHKELDQRAKGRILQYKCYQTTRRMGWRRLDLCGSGWEKLAGCWEQSHKVPDCKKRLEILCCKYM